MNPNNSNSNNNNKETSLEGGWAEDEAPNRKRRRTRTIVNTDDGLAIDQDDYRVIAELIAENFPGFGVMWNQDPNGIEMRENDKERRVWGLQMNKLVREQLHTSISYGNLVDSYCDGKFNLAVPTLTSLPRSIERLECLTELNLSGMKTN